jgi:PhzF family phenazine biosynthesis protein
MPKSRRFKVDGQVLCIRKIDMRQFLVDAFASAPFRGNPACVVEPFDVWATDAWMLALAAENNQAETAFLLKTHDPARFGLRWFTPKLEMPLCGHATLASAHVLLAELGNNAPVLTFDTLSGPLTVKRLANGAYEMDFPSRPPVQIDIPEGLEAALGVPVQEVWQGPYLLALVDDEATIRTLTPDIAAIERIASSTTGERGNLIVAAFGDAGGTHDMVSRFFAPGSGIPEDPATGSAHCILMPFYAHKTGKLNAQFFQAYPTRGGDIGCALVGDRVLLRGGAITVLEGVLRV